MNEKKRNRKRQVGDPLPSGDEQELDEIQQELNGISKTMKQAMTRMRLLRTLLTLLWGLMIIFFGAVLSVVSLNLTKENFVNYSQFLIFNEDISYYSEFINTTFIVSATLGAIVCLVVINMRSVLDKREDFTTSVEDRFSTNRASLKSPQEKNKQKGGVSGLDRLRAYVSEEHNQHASFVIRSLTKTSDSFQQWRDALLYTHKRLRNELKYMKSRNSKNLSTGVLSACLVIFWLLIIIFVPDKNAQVNSFVDFLSVYSPRFSIVIIAGTFSIFFLRLYTQNLRMIERNKNEITNIELRLTAGLMLCEKENKNKFAELSDTLSKEERNFVLDKNQSSATLDTDRLIEILSKFTPRIGG